MLLTKLSQRFHVKRAPVVSVIRNSSSAVTTTQNELVEAVEYPPIEDITFKASFRRFQEKKHADVKKVNTIEEKQIKINMPRYWGFKCMMYEEGSIFYNELPHAQYVTKTHVISEPKLPEVYENLVEKEKMDGLVNDIKEFLEDGIVFELTSRKHLEYPDDILKDVEKNENLVCEAIGKQVNRIMMSYLGKHYAHLREAEVDYNPRIEAFWFAGGIELHEHIIRGRKMRYWNDVLDEPADRPFQYLGYPVLQLRHKFPLREIIPLSECDNPDFDVPTYKYDPRTMGHAIKRRHGTNIPGFWPGDSSEFGLLSYHKRGYLARRNFGDDVDALKTQAIYANYGWLLAQAAHQGFTTFNDVTYPLINQAVITNGQWWSFCVYQLNTTLVNTWHHDSNPKRNLLWITEPMKLYESIDNGKLVGFNDEALRTLIKFYANVPAEREGVDMKPYVGVNERLIADIEDDERRNFVEAGYKYIMSNRPRHRLPPELYHWEIIYKHQFKTRPMDKRRTPWDYGINPLLRRLDKHHPKYIPKALRPETAKKVKWAKTYWP